MGVDLKDIIKSREITLERLSGHTIAIDAYNALYQFLASIRGETGEPLMDKQGRITSHISGLFYRNINLLALGIKPIYIMDGKPPSLKTNEIERRKAEKQKAVVKYMKALSHGDNKEAKKYAQATSVMKDYMIEDTKKMVSLLGIPFIEAPSEGEATAAYFTSSGITSATASQDFDSLLFGASKLIRNLTVSGKRKLPGRSMYVQVEPEEIELGKLLSNLEVTRSQLVDIGILIGTDFNPEGFRGIGPVRALKFIKKYECLERVPDIQIDLRDIDYEGIREIFLHPDVASLTPIKWEDPNSDGIIEFLCDEHSFSEARVTKALQKLEDVMNKKSETLERWFS